MTLSLVWKTRFKKKNILRNFTTKKYKGIWDTLYTLFMINNPMLNPCYYQDEKLAKMVRVTLYFTRSLLLLAYNSIFASVMISADGTYAFSVYIILLPYITYVPIIFIVTLLLSLPPHKNFTTGTKIRVGIGSFLTLGVIIGCYIIVLVIGAQSTSEERYAFIINFIITVLQDMVFNPSIGTLTSFIVYKIYRWKPEKFKHPQAKKVVEGVIKEEGMEIYDDLTKYKQDIYKPNDQIMNTFNLNAPKSMTLQATRKHRAKVEALEEKREKEEDRTSFMDGSKDEESVHISPSPVSDQRKFIPAANDE
jgi:hypothetical protein